MRLKEHQKVVFVPLLWAIAFFCIVGIGERPAIASGHAEDPRKRQETAQSIDSLFVDISEKTPGLAIAVARGGKIIFQKGYGSANLEYGVPIVADSVFNVGSVSKQFTAYAILLLEARGQLSLDDSVRKHLPELSYLGDRVTIRQLCNHTSGLPDQWSLLTLAGWRMDDVITKEQTLGLISRQTKLNFTPGERYLYSNSGYFLLAEIVARVSGSSFRDFAQEQIFAPLGMENTQVVDDYRKVVIGRSYSYGGGPDGYKKRISNASVTGPTSVFSSANDLIKWANNFADPTVGTAETIKKLNSIAVLNSGESAILTVNAGGNVYVTPGQFKWNFRGTPIFNHTGSVAGFESYLARFPEKDLSVVILSNNENRDVFKDGLAVADLVIGSEVEAKPAQVEMAQTPKPHTKEPFIDGDVSEYLGHFYNEDLATHYEVFEQDNGLALRHLRHGDIELSRISEDSFSGRIEFPVALVFQRDSDGRVEAFAVSNFGAKEIVFKRRTS